MLRAHGGGGGEEPEEKAVVEGSIPDRTFPEPVSPQEATVSLMVTQVSLPA